MRPLPAPLLLVPARVRISLDGKLDMVLLDMVLFDGLLGEVTHSDEARNQFGRGGDDLYEGKENRDEENRDEEIDDEEDNRDEETSEAGRAGRTNAPLEQPSWVAPDGGFTPEALA